MKDGGRIMKRTFLKKVMATVLAASVTVSMAGCGSSSGSTATTAAETKAAAATTAAAAAATTAASGGEIKIAVAAPMTGDNSEYGIGFYNAASMMADEWNAKGGVLGKQVKIVQFDDKSSPEEATTVAQKIVSEGDIAGVIGHFSSGCCMTAAKVYQANKVIEISPSASQADYSKIGDFIFRNNTVITKEGAAAVEIATKDMGKKKVGIISIKTDWGTSTGKVIEDILSKTDGVTMVDHEEVMENSDDYSPAITKLNAAGAEVVILVGMYGLDAPVAKQYKEINPDIKLVGFSNAYSQELIKLGGEDVEGLCCPVIFFSESDDPAIQTYVKNFKSKYNDAPSALTSQAYDSTGMLLEAIKAAGTTDSSQVRDKLAALDYKGVTGDTKFDENGDVDKSFTKVMVKDGKFALMNLTK